MSKFSFNGRLMDLMKLQSDLYEEMNSQPKSWTQIDTDTLILVRDSTKDDWQKLYYARFHENEDVVICYSGGRTSKTTSGPSDCKSWRYFKLIN